MTLKIIETHFARPQPEELVKMGIIKDAVIGSTLQSLADRYETQVPFVLKTLITRIESKTDFMQSEGIYRIPGNLAQIQGIHVFICLEYKMLFFVSKVSVQQTYI